MDPVTIAALITGGSALVGGLGSMFGQQSSNRAMMRFQERMSNTAWQRGVRDMRMAGINPIAAFGSAAASTPGVNLANPMEGFAEGVSSAGRAAGLERQLKKAEIAATEAQAEASRQSGNAAESQALTTRMAEHRHQAEFNRDTPYMAVVRELEKGQRMEDIKSTASARALTEKQREGAEADLKGREFEARQYEALERRLEKSFGPGVMRDAARIILMILRSRAGTSAVGSAVSAIGRR